MTDSPMRLVPRIVPAEASLCEALRLAPFWDACAALPEIIRKRADHAFELLKADSRHPSLHFKKVGQFWSARVGLTHRALAAESDDGLLWFWIGDHAEYDRLVG